jgi:methylated-DNA-[protein]-cysteine S-methyltransferase
LLAATDLELVRVAYVSEDHDAVLRALGERISPRILHAPARLDTVVRQIEEYFEGGRHSFDVPLDWRLSNGFRQIVLRHLPEIGYGHTASYAMVARLADRPRAVRAVGTACATNPLPVVVPCHRVVRSAPPTGVPFMAQADATIANAATPSIRVGLGASGAALELVIGGALPGVSLRSPCWLR